MSIRAKILSVLICAMVLAFVVCTLAYLHVTELDSDIGVMVDETLPATNLARKVRRDLRSVEAAEDRMIMTDDSADRSSLTGAMLTLKGHATAGGELTRNTPQHKGWLELIKTTNTLGSHEARLAETLAIDVRELKGQQRRLEPRIDEAKKLLDALVIDLRAEGLRHVPDGGPHHDNVTLHGASIARDLAALLGEIKEFRYSTRNFEAFAADFQRRVIPRRLKLLRKQTEALDELALGPKFGARTAVIKRHITDLSRDLQKVNDRIFDVNGQLIGLTVDTHLERRRLALKTSVIEEEQWAVIDARRHTLTDERSALASLLLAFLVVGVLFVGGGAFAVMRSVTDSAAGLLKVSRRLKLGDMGARVDVVGSDELAQVGASFNTMADFLQSRRKRQNDYNAIVTTLNKTIGLQETLAMSLSEIVVKTGSSVGAIYLYDEGRDRLHLAEAHAIPAATAAKPDIRVGQGIIGQVAKNKRLAIVDRVPPQTFDLDTGLGTSAPTSLIALPMIHTDTLLGVIVLASTASFDPERVAFIEEIVFQIAVAVNTARFYQNQEATSKALRKNHDKLIEQQAVLETVNRRLEEANRIKTEFLANVTHELRTPLNSIIGFTELVADTADLDHRQLKRLNTVLRNAGNLLALINDLLDISKMESGNITLSIERFDLNELILEVVDMLAPLADNQGLELVVTNTEGLWMHSDRGKCKQILVNLVTNAVKFTEAGSIIISAEIDTPNRQVTVNVKDSGIGIRPEDLLIIFQKFRQLDGSSSRSYGGTGLGLAITRQLCEFLGGDVHAASIVGEGSTFTVVLPLNLEAGTNAPNNSEELRTMNRPGLIEVARGGETRRPDSMEGEGGRDFILVMDDDPQSVVDLREGLRDRRIEVKSAFTAQDAVDILGAFDPVCVVIGATLPEDDGSSAMANAWASVKDKRIPVVLVSRSEGEIQLYGYPVDEAGGSHELTETKIARVVGVVQRPVRPEDVVDRLVAADVLDDGPRPSHSGNDRST